MATNLIGSPPKSSELSSIAIKNRVEETLRRLNPNTQSYTRVIKSKHKQPSSKNKNDSSQLMTALLNNDCEPENSRENVKNISYIGPSSHSITYLLHDLKEIKMGRSQKIQISSQEKARQYKPYLAERQPEYVGNKHRNKSLQQIKDVNKKYNLLLGKNKLNPIQSSKGKIFSPLKLCDQGKVSKKFIDSVTPTRRVQELISASSTRGNKNHYCSTSTTLKCRDTNKISTKSRKLPPKRIKDPLDSNFKQHDISETNSKYDYNQDLDYECSDCFCSTPFVEYSKQRKQKKSLRNLHNFDKSNGPTNSCFNSNSELEDPGKNYPCSLHNIVKFRNENYTDTHTTPTKESNSKLKLQTYIFDERLFPVLIQSKNETNRTDDKYSANLVSSSILEPIGNASSHLGITLQNSKVTGQPGNSQNKTSDKLKRGVCISHSSTNSLALKHQKGVR